MIRFILSIVILSALAAAKGRGEEPAAATYQGKPVHYWMGLLRTGNQAEQNAAYEAILAFGPEAKPILPDLVKLLDDRCTEYRRRVFCLISAIGPEAKPAIPRLIRFLRKEKCVTSIDELWPQRQAFAKIGPDALSALLEEMKKPAGIHAELIRALPEFREDGKVADAILLKSMDHKESEVCRASAEVLLTMGKQSAVIPAMIGWLQRDSYLRDIAIDRLGELGAEAKAAAPALRKLFASLPQPEPGEDDPNRYVRSQLAEAVKKVEAPSRVGYSGPPIPPMAQEPIVLPPPPKNDK